MHCQNVRVVFNFAETVHRRNSWNKSHAKFKAFKLTIFSANVQCTHTFYLRFHIPNFNPNLLTNDPWLVVERFMIQYQLACWKPNSICNPCHLCRECEGTSRKNIQRHKTNCLPWSSSGCWSGWPHHSIWNIAWSFKHMQSVVDRQEISHYMASKQLTIITTGLWSLSSLFALSSLFVEWSSTDCNS